MDVGGLVWEVVAELTAGHSQEDVQIDVGPLPPVHADAAMLRVVFSNVVSNALKFSQTRSRSRIEVGASESDAEIVYHVKDNGVGFDPHLGHKLFSVFERLHSKEEFAGTGVGLATAARIVPEYPPDQVSGARSQRRSGERNREPPDSEADSPQIQGGSARALSAYTLRVGLLLCEPTLDLHRVEGDRRRHMVAITGIALSTIAFFALSYLMQGRARAVGLVAGLAIASAGWPIAASAASMPDTWITTKVKMALLVAEDVPAMAVRVDTIEGKVTLYGTVSSADEKARAARAAKDVEGVREVRDLLQVVETSRQEAVGIADDALSASVEKRLGSDPALRDSKIRVKSVNRGVVLLDGEAETLSAHLRALEVVRAVPGVHRVASEIESPETLADDEIWRDAKGDPGTSTKSVATDAWITTASKIRLMANSATPAFDINVDTREGVVTLFGAVPTEAARRAAETEVKKVDGVKSVENDLEIVPQVSAAAVGQQDEGLKDAIEKRLKAREDLSDASIDVEVANGVARLTGDVRGQSDRLTALTVARTTAGVRSVVGDLTVKGQ